MPIKTFKIMKKNQILAAIAIAALSFGANAQIRVNSSGQVGINNTSPAYRLDVSGNLRVTDSGTSLYYTGTSLYNSSGSSYLGTSSYFWGYLYSHYIFYTYTPIQYSDAKLKKDIVDLEIQTNKLMDLRPVKYKILPRLNESGEPVQLRNTDHEAEHIGFIAQEIKEVFPGLVQEDEEGTLGVKYIELIPILVKAYQEQQTEIAGLKARIEALENPKK